MMPNQEESKCSTEETGDPDLETRLLQASGIENEEDVQMYKKKLDRIQEGMHEWMHTNSINEFFDYVEGHTDLLKAEAIHLYLIDNKDTWYSNEYRFHNVIDNYLGNERIGDCKGLTSLNAVMARREGIEHSTAFDDDHVVSVIRDNEKSFLLDHTTDIGFTEDEVVSPYTEAPSDVLPTFILNSMANERIKNKAPAEALRILQRAMDDYPHHPLYHTKALAHLNIGEPKNALGDLDEAHKLNPQSPTTYHLRAEVLMALDDKENAKEAYSNSIQIQPKSTTLNQRALIYFEEGNADKAMDDIDEALRLEPENAENHANKARLLYMAGEPKDAITYFTEAIDRAPHNLRARKERGLIALYNGDDTTALTDFSKILNQKPDPKALLDRAHAYKRRGQDHLALRDYNWLSARGDIRGNLKKTGLYAGKGNPRCIHEGAKVGYRFAQGVVKGLRTWFYDTFSG